MTTIRLACLLAITASRLTAIPAAAAGQDARVSSALGARPDSETGAQDA